MIDVRIFFCLILLNVIGETRGVGEEGDNGNDKNDLLFGEMWRKAFEANRHNGKEREEKEEMAEKEVKEEQKEEVEEGNKLWKKVKREPIDEQLKKEEEDEENDGEKWEKMIKKEPKIEENEWESQSEEGSDQQQDDSTSDQNDLDQSADDDEKVKIESESDKSTEETKRKIIKSFDKMRKECKMKKDYKWEKIEKYDKMKKEYQMKKGYKWEDRNKIEQQKKEIIEKFDKIRKECKNEKDYKWEDRYKIEQEIAKKLGTYRNKIYKWKRELNQKKKMKSEEEKWEIIEKFDKLRKECKKKKGYTNEKRGKIEREIAKALGTHRGKIYKWKKKLNRKNVSESDEERKGDIIEKFDRMRKERTNEKGYTNEKRGKIEREIAKELGTYREKIYEWKKKLNRKNVSESDEERKRDIIETFDIMRKEHKMEKGFKKENRYKIEREIARKLGTYREKIYKWKKALTPLRMLYTEEQKRAIIEQFGKLCEEFSNKFNRKPTKIIEEKIAKKFYVSRITINRWRKAGKERRDD